MFFLQRKNWNAEYLGEGDFINLIFTPRLQKNPIIQIRALKLFICILVTNITLSQVPLKKYSLWYSFAFIFGMFFKSLFSVKYQSLNVYISYGFFYLPFLYQVINST